MSALRALSFVFGILLFLAGGVLNFIPWMEDSDGDFHSVNSSHNLCQDTFVAAFAADECEFYNTMYSVGMGLIIFGIILLLAGIMPGGGKQQVIVQNPPTQRVNYQNIPVVQQPVQPPVSSTKQLTEDKEYRAPSDKFCTNCGAKLSSSSKFCTECGTQLQ